VVEGRETGARMLALSDALINLLALLPVVDPRDSGRARHVQGAPGCCIVLVGGDGLLFPGLNPVIVGHPVVWDPAIGPSVDLDADPPFAAVAAVPLPSLIPAAERAGLSIGRESRFNPTMIIRGTYGFIDKSLCLVMVTRRFHEKRVAQF